jgi:hypothetical protein
MPRLSSALALASCLLATSVLAAPAELAHAFGNTVVSTYPDGRTAELWLQASGAYTAMGRRGDRSSGHWKVKGDQLCLKQSSPFPAPFTYCTAMPSTAPNASWSAKAVTGEAIRVKLVKGRFVGHPRQASS